MKKIIYSTFIILFSLFLLGCGREMTAREAVNDYLQNYITLDSSVVDQIDEIVNSENLTDEQKIVYKDIIKREYASLTYNILNERYEGDTAYVTVKINVIDLYKVQQDALKYYSDHIEDFNNDNGVYDNNLFINYKLEQMKKTKDTINYEIEFVVKKVGNDWDVEQLSNENLEKIHGVYNYKE